MEPVRWHAPEGQKKGKTARLAGVRGVLSDDYYWLWPDVSGDRQLAQGLVLTQSHGTCRCGRRWNVLDDWRRASEIAVEGA